MPRALRPLRATLSAALLAAWGVALVATLRAAWAQHYLAYGFLHTLAFDLRHNLSVMAAPVAAAVLVMALLSAWRARRGAPVAPFVLRLVAIAAGATLFLRLGYIYNRYSFGGHWWRKQDVGPLRLPEALSRWDVWRTNLLIALGALGLGLAVYLVLRLIVRRRPEIGTRFWRALGHPTALLAGVVLVGGTPVLARALHARVAAHPNFILVSLDTLRADRMSLYGCDRPTTPRIDALGRESIVFDWTIAQAPNTPPSHMSIFTSLYPTIHGFQGSGDRLAGRCLTVTEYLRDAGYRTLATTDGGFMRGRFGFGQGFEHFDDHDKGIARSVPLVFDWIDHGRTDPRFFIFLHCYDIHSPYDPPQPYRDLYTDPDYQGGFNPGSRELEQIREAVNTNPTAGHGLSPADVAYILARYDGGVTYADHWMGEFVEGLRTRGLLANTWLIVTSDHGEEFTEHGSVLHEKLYHTVTRVPLIIRPPDDPRFAGAAGTRRGTRVPEVVELIDLMPTLLELIGRPAAAQVQGASLVGLLQGWAESWKNAAYSELPWYGRQRALTTPVLHLITSLDGETFEAYDYPRDPLEQAAIPYREWSAELPVLFRDLRDWSEHQLLAAAGQGQSTRSMTLDEETLRQLRALGYLK